MTTAHTDPQLTALTAALRAPKSSTRLKAALAAGTDPEPGVVDELIARCATEPDFYVRDMLTWALTRFPAETTVPKLLDQLASPHDQARSQALHTLSKIGDPAAWPAVTRDLLRDPNDEVARAAWRAAAALVPDGQERALAAELAAQFGRGDRDVKASLSRVLVALGEAAEPAIRDAMGSGDPLVAAHAAATERLLRDPDAAFELHIDAAKRAFALGGKEPDAHR
ncbi:HEAT repeat domain-containing protein [Glycomyces terrestris]|uniref:HEAT repeat domain-containing protein n=1 Tax=Glycomyces terrestris TaxID=2493553 RepID=A0A426UT55_9ACTN|nr:HEAT repeat domain-containing protein [Glycomyces terrestris]RRR96833.1 HEAT repeat domain-containing protein [Glycomyces terrestris]